ncbi:MFS transporter [Microbacterium rhizophilus]|uniref:MFS transporter n=1 Tax=Microbacterium rhizophilus TaxID=3138934 RepID=UPI0031E82300
MTTIDVKAFVEGSRFSRFHGSMLFWACFIITFDMYDLVVYGSVLPVLLGEWGIDPLQAGTIGSVGIFGMAIGAVGFGVLADRFGRKRMLILAVALFSAAAFLCAFAPGPVVFAVFRFISGVGIGGILPSVIAMATDYAPRKLANTMVAVIMCFFSVGGILAAFVAMLLLPTFGWQSVYIVAIIPLLLLPLAARSFQDSPTMHLRRGSTEKLRAVLILMNPRADIPADATLDVPAAEKETGASIATLFRGGRALATIMVWIAFFMCLLMINGISTWLPNLMVTAGYALGAGLTFMITYNVGAIVGTLVMGRVADAWGVKRVLVPMFVVSAVAIVLLGLGADFWILLALTALAGACTMGSQNISYSFVSEYYPSAVRSTAIGLASGVGRIGAIIGPTFGGWLLTTGMPAQLTFLWFAVRGVIAAIAFAFVPLARARTTGTAPEPHVDAVAS